MAGAATSIFLSRQTRQTNKIGKHVFVATKMILVAALANDKKMFNLLCVWFLMAHLYLSYLLCVWFLLAHLYPRYRLCVWFLLDHLYPRSKNVISYLQLGLLTIYDGQTSYILETGFYSPVNYKGSSQDDQTPLNVNTHSDLFLLHV